MSELYFRKVWSLFGRGHLIVTDKESGQVFTMSKNDIDRLLKEWKQMPDPTFKAEPLGNGKVKP